MQSRKAWCENGKQKNEHCLQKSKGFNSVLEQSEKQ